MSCLRGCLAAATADHLRESVGLRSKETDSAAGLSLNLAFSGLKNRSRVGGAIGIKCKVGFVSVSDQ